MRIIGGTHRGRKFHPPAKMQARPTTDIAKEGLFNTLNNMLAFEGLKALELFGGTGSISYELASRGATDITLVEKDRKLLSFIRDEITALGFENYIKVVPAEVFQFLSSCTTQYQFIFADPPYALKEMDQLPVVIFENHLLQPNGVFVLEHTQRNNYEQHPNFEKKKNYGTTIFSFFRQREEIPHGVAP